jgi:DNA invertase Pin-like site-specific DNA recombinase
MTDIDQTISEMWLRGESARAIGSVVGLTQHEVLIARARLNLPKRVLGRDYSNRKVDTEDIADIKDLIEAGESIQRVKTFYGVSAITLKRRGIV